MPAALPTLVGVLLTLATLTVLVRDWWVHPDLAIAPTPTAVPQEQQARPVPSLAA